LKQKTANLEDVEEQRKFIEGLQAKVVALVADLENTRVSWLALAVAVAAAGGWLQAPIMCAVVCVGRVSACALTP
jgi:hypothetical protein